MNTLQQAVGLSQAVEQLGAAAGLGGWCLRAWLRGVLPNAENNSP